MINKTIFIVGGGNVDNRQLFNMYKYEIDQKDNFVMVIGADRGVIYAEDAGCKVDLAVGDFDSVNEADKKRISEELRTVSLNPVKDDTDFEHALREAITEKPQKIICFGVTGTRLDQTLASISMLYLAVKNKIDMVIIDKNNRIRMVKDRFTIKKNEAFGKYFSVMPFCDSVTHLNMNGFKYETEDLTLEKYVSRGVSNEITAETANISCDGYLVIMETKD